MPVGLFRHPPPLQQRLPSVVALASLGASFDATVTGVSALTAALTTAIPLVALIDPQSVFAAAITAPNPVVPTLGAAAAQVGRFGHRAQAVTRHVFAPLSLPGQMAADIAGQSAILASLTSVIAFGGTIAGQSAVAAALSAGSSFSGVIAAQSLLAAGLTTGGTYIGTRTGDVTLVAYWRLGESSGTTAADYLGAHPGTYVNAPLLAQTGALSNDADKAVDFSGASPGKYVTVAGLTMPATPTIEAWVNSSAWTDEGLIGQWTDTGGCMLYLNASGAVSLYVNATPLTTSVNSSWLSGYHYIVGTYDGTTGKIYVDGVLQASGALTGPIAPTGTFQIAKYGAGIHPFTGKVDEAAVSSSVRTAAQILTQFNAAGGSGTGAAATTYGPAWRANTKANIRIGDTNAQKSSVRFKAATTSTLVSFIATPRGGAGYSLGTGGIWRNTLQTDNGAGAPSGTILATQDYTPGIPSGGTFVRITFASPASLTQGNLYHLVIQNVDANPTVNWCSVNDTFIYGGVLSPRQPKYADADYARLTSVNGGAFAVAGQYGAVIDLTYANGTHQGNGYIGMIDTDTPVAGSVDYANITSTSFARERFVVSGGDKIVTGGEVFMRRTSGTANLHIELYATAGDTLIEQVSILATAVAISAPGGDNGGMTVVPFTFSASHTLTNGTSYYLRLSTTPGTTYSVSDVRKGTASSTGLAGGFNTTTYFGDGEAEYTTNSGGSWIRMYTGDGAFGSGPDWMCHFTLA